MGKLKKSGFLEGAFIATVCIIITKILGVLYVIPFYNIIGEKGGTLYGYAYNIYNIFLIISSAGIPLAISKLTSEYATLKQDNKKIRMYQISTKVIMIFSVVSFLICFLFAPLFAKVIVGDLTGGNSISDVSLVIRTISFALLIIPMLSIKRGYLQGHTYIKEPSISQIIEQVVRIAIIIVGSYLCVKVFHLPVKYAIVVSTLAAAAGGLITYLYLDIITRRNKKQLGLDIAVKENKKDDREIIKKIITYSIPFIVINLVNNATTFVDMLLLIKTLPKLGFSATTTEFVGSVFTTWGVKINTIITSIANGLIISLIPNMVKDFNEKNTESMNQTFNKCLKIILLIIAPLAIFMSAMSTSMWNTFYSPNEIGSLIIKFNIIVTIFDCLYIVVNSLLQSINAEKIIYKSVIIGQFVNVALDIPFMFLFDKIGWPAYYGAIAATLMCFIISTGMSMHYLNKEMHLNYKETIASIPRFVISSIILIIMLKLTKTILPVNSASKLTQLTNLLIAGVVCGGTYLLINFKSIISILPEKLVKKLKLSEMIINKEENNEKRS